MSNALATDPITMIRLRMFDGAFFATATGATCTRPGSVFGATSVLTTLAGSTGRGRDEQTYIHPSAKATLVGRRAWGPPV